MLSLIHDFTVTALPMVQDALAVAKATASGSAGIGAGIAAGGAVIGAGIGIGLIGGGAGEGIARQPEAADTIKGNALLLAALVEGVALFAVVVGLLMALK